MSDAAPTTDDELAAMESQVRFLSSGVACDTMRLIAEVRRLRAERDSFRRAQVTIAKLHRTAPDDDDSVAADNYWLIREERLRAEPSGTTSQVKESP